MKTIKFSHYYKKLYCRAGINPEEFARLLAVIPVNLEDLHPAFFLYDTDMGKYSLPKKGKYLLLLFDKHPPGYNLFTTLRRSTPTKEKYYRKSIGETFEVEIMK